ncbi:MAG: thioester-forming surface-anchored protein, partial [Berryella intestinalis]|uniref:thioester-forming surface-anchored protein n=1 Tax=Berryella intestinalis TaxID=1531429 RepID=UPI002A7488BD
MQSRKRRIGLFGALALAAVAVALAVTASLLGGSAAANAAGLANNARAESSNGVYYVQDPAHRLRVYTSDYKVAEDWAFCINNGRSYPGFFPPGDPENPDEDKPYIDGKYYYVGNEDKNFQDMLSTFLASRPLNNDQTTKAVRELLYVFHEDPEGWREKNLALFPKTDRGDLLWYWQIQQAIWHFSDNATMPNLLPREYVDRIERIARGTEKSLIPDTKKLEMRSYDAAGGWWRFGKQNVVSARVTENVEHYVRVIKLDGEKYGTMSDEQLIPVIEQNDQGLKGAKFGMYFEEGLIEFIDNSKPEKPLIPVQWETGSYARLFQFWEGDHAFRIAEEEAPKGYAFADPVNYTFDSRGNVKLVGDTDNVNERLITKDKINWQNYKYDKEFKEIPADVIVVFNYKSENTHPVKIEKTGSVMQDGKFSMQAIEGAKFKLQNTSSPDAAPIEWTSEAYLPKLLDLKPGFYELTEISAPEGYEKGIGMVTFRVESTGVITLNNGDADGAVTVSGNKLSVKNDSVRGVKTFATWKNEKAKRLFYDGQEYTNAPEELTVTDRIEYRGFEPGWYYAFATFVKNNGGEPVYSDGYVEFLVEDGKPDGVANVELNVKKSAIDVNAQTSFTVIEKIYKKDQVKEDEHQVPVRPEASVPTYAEHNDLESFDQTVMIDVTKPQSEVAFNKYDMKGAILDGAVLSVEINRDGQWVGLHEWTTAAQEDTVRLQLPAGSFRLVEKAAPAGYAVPANNLVFEFTVDDNGV